MLSSCRVSIFIATLAACLAVVTSATSRMTIANMSCHFIRQPLDHFAFPLHHGPEYSQRYCTYEFAQHPNTTSPVLFYTGNESPLETYINHTGLMWQLAASLGATVVFAEHRYEGQSLPPFDIPNCLAHSSSWQALADYARLIERRYKPRPVVLFGGSYGGMLSAWMRATYPHLVAGAIAASAPVWGLPLASSTIDGAFSVVRRGLEQSYPPIVVAGGSSTPRTDRNFCADNLLATWPLIQVLADSKSGQELLTEAFALCTPLGRGDAPALIEWAQSPWFDLAEGSFPYPSSYIPFALTHDPDATLPAWPLQAACWNASRLHADLGIQIVGSPSEVRFSARYGDSDLSINVDWDNATVTSSADTLLRAHNSSAIQFLLKNVRDAIGLWFNMTQDVECYDLKVAPSRNRMKTSAQAHVIHQTYVIPSSASSSLSSDIITDEQQLTLRNSSVICEHRVRSDGSWPPLYCNEEMNLIITEARGHGRDSFWPPSYPREVHTYADVVVYKLAHNLTMHDFCKDLHGIFGFSNRSADPWSTWLDTRYGGTRIKASSNIIFSNGLLDPWSAAGVYSVDPMNPDFRDASYSPAPGVYIQHISDNRMIALIMELGGHHTDLMYDDEADHASFRYAREVEHWYIAEWIREWNSAKAELYSETY